MFGNLSLVIRDVNYGLLTVNRGIYKTIHGKNHSFTCNIKNKIRTLTYTDLMGFQLNV